MITTGPGCRRRRTPLATVLAVLGLLTALSLVTAPAASAHPLGNATVNHYDGLRLFPGHITVRAIEDTAEIPYPAACPRHRQQR